MACCYSIFHSFSIFGLYWNANFGNTTFLHSVNIIHTLLTVFRQFIIIDRKILSSFLMSVLQIRFCRVFRLVSNKLFASKCTFPYMVSSLERYLKAAWPTWFSIKVNTSIFEVPTFKLPGSRWRRRKGLCNDGQGNVRSADSHRQGYIHSIWFNAHCFKNTHLLITFLHVLSDPAADHQYYRFVDHRLGNTAIFDKYLHYLLDA